ESEVRDASAVGKKRPAPRGRWDRPLSLMNKSRSGYEAFLFLSTVHVVNGFLGFARRRENGSLVVLQNPQPRSHISGMIRPRFVRKAKFSTQKRCPQFGNEFLSGVRFTTKAG